MHNSILEGAFPPALGASHLIKLGQNQMLCVQLLSLVHIIQIIIIIIFIQWLIIVVTISNIIYRGNSWSACLHVIGSWCVCNVVIFIDNSLIIEDIGSG
uniref:Transmembrane protein n=1 Tax=Rhizophora mucronata TaxID=61149 RepID=A0A2P2LP75_RHIMU